MRRLKRTEARKREFHTRIILGIELESYTIAAPEYSIGRALATHRKGVTEKGERFTRDWSIGTEYNSRPFGTIREGLFLLKTGLRKYNASLYRTKSRSRERRQIFLVGGWRDRFAGTHIHLSEAGKNKITLSDARLWATHLHDHLPLLVAMGANSPVWADEITNHASNRVLKGSKKYFQPIRKGQLDSRPFKEMLLNKAKTSKPPTLEIRILDSNIPEFVMAAACIVKACTLAVLKRKRPTNNISQMSYLRGRLDAARKGMKAKLSWNGRWMPATEYLDRFIWTYREELKAMDIPQDVWTALKLLKRGVNGSHILHAASFASYKKHPQTWQRRFAKRYANAIAKLLDGNSLEEFLHVLGQKFPDISEVSLGRKGLRL